MMTIPRIEFKALVESDLSLMYDWFHKPHVMQWYARGEDYTLEMIRQKYLPRLQVVEKIPSFLIYLNDYPIGYIQLYQLSYSLPEGVRDYQHPLFSNAKPHDMAGIDLFVAEELYLGKGYATLALQRFIEEQLRGRFRWAVADPLKINQHAIRFFERNGFKKMMQSPIESLNELMVLHVD